MQIFPNDTNSKRRFCSFMEFYVIHLKNQGVKFDHSTTNCWRALARQLPILYNREKKAKSVGCKIEDMRSQLCFYIRAFRGACECTWKY